jgi:hypothetical protein
MVKTIGIPKWMVLKALYDHSRTQGMGRLQYRPEPMTEVQARQLTEGKRADALYFDYLQGRVLKVDLRKDEGFDEWLYDRDLGPGAAQRAIDSVLEQLTAPDA